MRPIQPYRRRSLASFWLGVLLVLLMAGGGTIGLLLLLGVSLNPFAGVREDPFMVRIPINSRPIPAYTRVEREHLLNPTSGGLMYQRIPPAAVVGMSITGIADDGSHVESVIQSVRNAAGQVVFLTEDGRQVPQERTMELGGAVMNVSAIVGRVVKRDKRSGLGFREDNFFPQGTPTGIAGATPPGMRAVTLDATKLTGVHALNAGDRIDLLASVPANELGSFQSQYQGRLPAAALVASSTGDRKANSAVEPVLLAQNAVVLKPVYVRQEVSSTASLTQGRRVQNIPKYEVALAVSPEDLIPLQSALNKSLTITCIAHSMQPDRNETPVVADHPDDVIVPVTVRPILAYDVVSREAFVNPGTRRVRFEPVSRQQIDRLDIVTSLDEALGAVVRYDIPAGRYLRRADLLSGTLPERPTTTPSDRSITAGDRSTTVDRDAAFRFVSERRDQMASLAQAEDAYPSPTAVGDRPAITRFIPPGHTAFAMPWNRLYGAEHLQIGDRIDLLASFSLSNTGEMAETETRPDGTTIQRTRHDVVSNRTLRTWDESFGSRGEPWFVATDAVVVGPVGFPPPPAAQRALGDSLLRRESGSDAGPAISGPPMIIAVDDRDVEAVATALAAEQVLFTAAFHSSGEGTTPSTDMKEIVIAAQNLDAYEAFSETIWQGNRRRPLLRRVRVDDSRFSDALTLAEIADFEYRVLRRGKLRGEFFTADDFLPSGTLPGVAAAATPGHTIFAVANDDIAGLDTFNTNDFVVILARGIAKPPQGEERMELRIRAIGPQGVVTLEGMSPPSVIAHGFGLERPVSMVVVPRARIVRASRKGQAILEIPNPDLTRLQAAWAASKQSDDGEGSSLLAVALPRNPVSSQTVNEDATDVTGQDIANFDPMASAGMIETMVGRTRQSHYFAGRSADSTLAAIHAGGAPAATKE